MMKLKRSRSPMTHLAIVFLGTCFLSSCTYMWVGHKIDPKHVQEIRIGSTTEQAVLDAFGRPDTIALKGAEGVRVLIYKNFRHTGLALPFPFLQVGKTADKGYVLTVLLKDGVVINYEFVHMQGAYIKSSN